MPSTDRAADGTRPATHAPLLRPSRSRAGREWRLRERPARRVWHSWPVKLRWARPNVAALPHSVPPTARCVRAAVRIRDEPVARRDEPAGRAAIAHATRVTTLQLRTTDDAGEPVSSRHTQHMHSVFAFVTWYESVAG